jgi:peptidoglycan hydrolase-like protein with peptidoglycan-binding domain
MGRARCRRAAATAAALTAASVLLAGCGSIQGVWSSDDATPAPQGSSGEPTQGSWSPTGGGAATPTPSHTPTPSPTPSDTSTATPGPKPTTKPAPSPSATAKPRTSLIRGDSGPKVLALQRRLTELGYWLGAPDGSFGSLTQQAVWALQKSAGLTRDGVVGPRTRKALEAGIRPRATISGNGVEIDLDRQILMVVRGGSVRTILNTSTGSREEYTATSGNRAIAVTPRGSFTVYRAVDGPVTNSLGQLWRPRFFHRGIAVHGSGNIPPWPDSHGCARVSNAAIDMIWASDLMPIGSRVVVR